MNENRGDLFIGEYKNNNIEGFGQYYWSSGETFYGYWQNGKRKGFGTNIKNGQILTGVWDGPSLIKPDTLPTDFIERKKKLERLEEQFQQVFQKRLSNHDVKLAQFSSGNSDKIQSKDKPKQTSATQGAVLASKDQKQKTISDTQTPLIKITASSSNNRRGAISGIVKYNSGIAELRVDGEVVPLKRDGSFEWQGFVPAGGKLVVIEAIDTAGLSASQKVRLERGQQNKVSVPLFAELDPFRGKAAKKNRNALALIVGVANYERTPDPAIYADKDAQYFHDYAAIKLGVPDNNIFTMINQDADRIEIKKAVKNWLLRMSVKNETDVYVFFAGHGLASSDGSNMFLLPYDGDPELLEDSAIDRKQLFADIQAISPRSVTVFLDSCYSGGTRDGGTLVASLRPIAIRAKEQNVPDGFTILSAAKGDQTSQSLEEAKHGLFSYFLMKGLEGDADANNDNQITAGELHSFVTEKVERQSGFKQTPDLQGDAGRVLVRFQ